MNKNDYIKEGDRQLNTKYYQQINDYDTSSLRRKIKDKIIDLHAKGYIDQVTYDFLNDSLTPRMGRLYLLPKLHKLEQTMFDLITYM